jgi:diguanylate cyclase (GGDEF)-like protein
MDDMDIGPALDEALFAERLEIISCRADDDVLARVVETHPDIVLIAGWLPGDAALTLCRQLRDFDVARLRSIVVLGPGYATESDVARTLDSGADDYVSDVRRVAELRARVRCQIRHLRDREVMRWARQQRSTLRDLANTDPLTGIGNRRRVERGLEDAAAAGEATTIVLVDLDHFKRVNDTHGHVAGDIVLCRVARALQDATPPDAVLARWGGEEFVLLLRGQQEEPLSQIGERLRRAVGDIVFFEIDGALRVTASVGVAAWDGTGNSPPVSEVLGAADAALYEAKKSGRNRVRTSLVAAG